MNDFYVEEALWPYLEKIWNLNGEQQESLDLNLRSMLALRWYCIEVGNGGSEQFYYNSPDYRPRDLVRGLDLIGFPAGATAVQQSWIIFSDIDSRERRISEMQGLTAEALEQHFTPCEEIIFRARDGGLAQYLRMAMTSLPFFTDARI